MPIGDPKKQTIYTKKYEANVGIVAKTYKLKKVDVERFASACAAAGTNQSAALTELIRAYSDKVLGK